MYELQFPLLLDKTEFESDGFGTNSPGPEKKRKRGLGKGGAAAKYCTMSVPARMAQFPDEPFEERLDLLNQPMMWCLACGKPVAHQTKSFVASHLTRQCHIAGKAHIAKQKAKKEAVAKQKDEEVVAMQRVSTLRQPTLGHVVSYHAERFAVQDDLGFTMLASGIPVEKLDHPIMRAFLRKYTSVSGCLSQLGSEFPKHNCSRLQDAHQKVIGDKLRGQSITLVFDEWTDDSFV